MRVIRDCMLIILILTVGFSIALAWQVSAAEEISPGFQKTPLLLRATKILPKDMRVGQGFRLDENIMNDGFVNTYQLKSLWGSMTLESTALLRIRVNELRALNHMEELKKTNVFADAFKAGATAPLKTAKGIVTAPVDTISDVGTGLGRWFSDIGRSIVNNDPHQANTLSTVIGYAAAKRKFAYEYGIDPYTDYEPVQKRLAEIARVSVAGGLTTKIAFKAVKGGTGMVLSITAMADTMRKLVRDKSPAELAKINKEKLKAMGIQDNIAEAFLENPLFNPQETTLLVGELTSINHVMDRQKVISIALTATDTSIARFIRMQVQMMSNYHANVAPIVRIVDVNGTPFVQRKDGVVVGLFPLDYIAWTAALWRKEIAASRDIKNLPGAFGKELWIEGAVSQVARRALEERGWKVEDNVGDKLVSVQK